MKPLTIGDLKKLIEEQKLPDDMKIFVLDHYSGGMSPAFNTAIEPHNTDLHGRPGFEHKNTLEIW